MTIAEYLESKQRYVDYITDHKENVNKAFHEYLKPLRYEFDFCMSDMLNRIYEHDDSKFGASEFEPYRKWYYPINGEERDEAAFDKAWKHHYMVMIIILNTGLIKKEFLRK